MNPALISPNEKKGWCNENNLLSQGYLYQALGSVDISTILSQNKLAKCQQTLVFNLQIEIIIEI